MVASCGEDSRSGIQVVKRRKLGEAEGAELVTSHMLCFAARFVVTRL
jgi:hypothetical protein